MNKFILTGRDGRPSTKIAYSTMKNGILAQRRQVFRGRGVSRILKKEYFRVFDNPENMLMRRESNIDFNNSIIVRWGTRQHIEGENRIIYNKIPALEVITNKKQSRIMFAEKGVSAPKQINIDNVIQEDLPIIARPFVHSKGRNFIVLKSIEALREHFNPRKYYYSAFVDKTAEYRIHTAHSKVLAVMKKHPVEGSIAWNRAIEDSDPFDYIRWNELDELNLMPVMVEAIKAVQAVGADFGGVDVMVDKDGKPYVLEVNSAPTLNSSPYVAERWGKLFDFLFKSDKRVKHWDYTKFKTAKGLIWKNFQLSSTPEELGLI